MTRASTLTPHKFIKPTIAPYHDYTGDFFCIGADDGSKGLILSHEFSMEATAFQCIYEVFLTAGSFPTNCVQNDLYRNSTATPFATLQQTVATLGWKRSGTTFSEVFAPGDELFVRTHGQTTGAGPPAGTWVAGFLTVYIFYRRYIP